MRQHPSTNPSQRAGPVARLSQRQVECLLWVEEGKSAGDIGQIIGISGRTVEAHLARACEVLGVRTRVQAVVRARALGLLPPHLGLRQVRAAQARSFRPPRR